MRALISVHEAQNHIEIQDLNGVVSVTNDAEDVIEYLKNKGYNVLEKRIFYKDSEGSWDELLVRNGAFLNFKIHNAQSPSDIV